MSEQRVLKWTVPVDDDIHDVGRGAVIHVAAQYDQLDSVQVWTVEDWPLSASRRPVQVFGTGHPIPHNAVPVGSAVVAGGQLVWHVMELLVAYSDPTGKRTDWLTP